MIEYYASCFPQVRAIDNIGSGSMSKIFLRYTEPFWKTVPFLLTLSWTDKELREASAKDWSKGVLDFASFDSHEDMLICWLAGSHAKTADSKTDKEVKLDTAGLPFLNYIFYSGTESFGKSNPDLQRRSGYSNAR